MRNKIILLSFSFLISAFTVLKAQSKHALIFAIGNYPKDKGWSNLSSINDAKELNKTLSKQGFTDIRIYQNEKVTRSGIDSAFIKLINDPKLQKGDIVVIHFSAHGVQVEDDNNDEVDRLDETIVTYNALSPEKADKKDFKKNQSEYFRDDAFGDYIDQLRSKLGNEGDVIIFIDACHSGSGTRGITKVRGGSNPLVSENFNSNQYETIDVSNKEGFIKNKLLIKNESNLASFVVISAAKANETNSEAPGKDLGSLTYAIRQVFASLDSGITYRSFFAKVSTEMSKVVHYQTPIMEGNGLDRELFGGRYISQNPYLEIETIKGTMIEIKAGILSGMNIGAKVSLYPSGTSDHKKSIPFATGTVIKAENYKATVKLDKKLPIKKPTEAWVFVTETVYKTNPVSIEIVLKDKKNLNGFSENESTGIKKSFDDLPGFVFISPPEIKIVKGEIKNSISIKTASDGYLFKAISDTGLVVNNLKEVLKRYSQYKFLKNFEVKDPEATVEVNLVPFINKKFDTSKIDSKIINGNYEFNEGDQFAVWIRNKGTSPVYINILDLQPDGIINPIFPNKTVTDSNGKTIPIYPDDLLIDSNASRLFSNYPITLGPPYGKEIFKIFVSTNLIDMEQIADTKGIKSRGNFTVLAKLVKKSFSIATRDIGNENISTNDGSAFNVYFQIKPKKKK